MSNDEFSADDLDQRLDALRATYDEHNDACRYQSAGRVVQEIRRLAKSEHQLLAYIRATFNLMNDASSLLQPEVGRDASLEMIALLEHEDRARQFQPDFPEDGYEFHCDQFSTCAYDNFATATGILQGYNSDGMYACISDGMQVCRSTSKLECLKCFREYAAEVYEAADDLPMALHNSRLGYLHADPGPHDRRWVGALNESRLLLLQGQIDDAVQALKRAWSFRETYHSPYAARLQSSIALEQLLAVSGRLSEHSQWFEEDDPARDEPAPARGEFPRHDLRRDRNDSLLAFCNGDFDKSIELLETWDAKLRRQKCLSFWFDVRLQLLASLRLAGRPQKIEALARQLETEAKNARDWLTLRRLQRVLDPNAYPTPLALLHDLTSGPFARPVAKVAGNAPIAAAGTSTENRADEPVTDDTVASASDVTSEEPSRFLEFGMSLLTRLQAAEDEEQVAAVLNDLLALDPATVDYPRDGNGLLRIARLAFGEGERHQDVWQWASAIKANFPNAAGVLCQFASLGSQVNSAQPEGAEPVISEEELESLFQAGLDLAPDGAGNHALAGTFYLQRENHGEAERCLARAFRLDRTMSFAALQLADLYEQTGRARDALAVLDMCLREGSHDPNVCWQAVLHANFLEQYEPMLTYLDRLEEVHPRLEWSAHYRATAMLELDRPEGALTAADQEIEHFPEHAYAENLQRAAALALLGRAAEFRATLREILEVPLSEIDYLSITGLTRLHRRLWLSAQELPDQETLLDEYETCLLSSGLMPDEFFAARREQASTEPVPELHFFRCIIRQPLAENWSTSKACRMGEADWTSYDCPWGVLAVDEEDATQRVLGYQKRCSILPAVVLDITPSEETYRDAPGIVWQGARDESEERDDDAGDEDDWDQAAEELE